MPEDTELAMPWPLHPVVLDAVPGRHGRVTQISEQDEGTLGIQAFDLVTVSVSEVG